MGLTAEQIAASMDALAAAEPSFAAALARVGYPAPRIRERGYETLLRWHHPVDGMRLPGSFLDRAEESGLIVEIGEWVTDRVAATIARWHRAGLGSRLAINVSQRQIAHAAFFRSLGASLKAHGAPELMRSWVRNQGAEAFVRLHDGRFAAFAERQPNRRSRHAVLFSGDPTDPKTRAAPFRFLPPDRFDPSDATVLPGGDLLILTRRFRYPFSFSTIG